MNDTNSWQLDGHRHCTFTNCSGVEQLLYLLARLDLKSANRVFDIFGLWDYNAAKKAYVDEQQTQMI